MLNDVLKLFKKFSKTFEKLFIQKSDENNVFVFRSNVYAIWNESFFIIYLKWTSSRRNFTFIDFLLILFGFRLFSTIFFRRMKFFAKSHHFAPAYGVCFDYPVRRIGKNEANEFIEFPPF